MDGNNTAAIIRAVGSCLSSVLTGAALVIIAYGLFGNQMIIRKKIIKSVRSEEDF